jgi:hypothetical protein
MSRDIEPLRQILHRVLARYLSVRPGGFELEPRGDLRAVLEARILSYGGARTLYEERKPTCRSLDGLRSIQHKERTCAQCSLRSRCTPQVRVDLFVQEKAFRLLLAHTSARAFLLYEAELRARSLAIENVVTRIEVINRGSWGELHFTTCD